MPSTLLFDPLNSERGNKQLEEATQQFSVLKVPFQQVPLDLNTEKKNVLIEKNGNDSKSSTLQTRLRLRARQDYIARTCELYCTSKRRYDFVLVNVVSFRSNNIGY